MDLSLFPKNEEWGTGDEALDLRLNNGLKKIAENLSLQSIAEFYSFALSLKPRAYNPAFSLTIDLVAKALLYYYAPEECNDVLYKKMRGHYFEKNVITFHLEQSEMITRELKSIHKVRYKDQIDFSLHLQSTTERNPFVENAIKKSALDLQAKIIFKEFRHFLNGDAVTQTYDDPFFMALQQGKSILHIEKFAEIWYDKDQLFSLSLIA